MKIIFYESKPVYYSKLVLKFGTTIDDMIKIYFKLKGRKDLINYSGNEINFSWDNANLKFGDKTPIEIFFENAINPIVKVNLNNINFFNSINNNNKLSTEEVDDALLMIHFNQIFYEKNMYIEMINKNNNIKFKIDNDILNKCLKKHTRFYERLIYEINKGIKGPKINVIFNRVQGESNNLILNYGTTIGQMLKIYLGRFYIREDIMDKLHFYICFNHNCSLLKIDDKTPVERNNFGSVFVNNVNGCPCLIDNYEENELLYLIGKQIREEIYGLDSAH